MILLLINLPDPLLSPLPIARLIPLSPPLLRLSYVLPIALDIVILIHFQVPILNCFPVPFHIPPLLHILTSPLLLFSNSIDAIHFYSCLSI